MAKLIVLLALALSLALYFGFVQPNSASHPNAPEGALEYFESPDGSQYVALFEDELVAVSERKEDSFELDIPLGNIASTRTTGYILVVINKDGSEIKVNLPSTQAANRVEERIQELQ